MKELLNDFLEHLALNENSSAHTVRAYESDLSQFFVFLAGHTGRKRFELEPADFSHLNIRAFLGDLQKKGNSRASAARKLAALRTFGRYLRREGILEGDPASLVGTSWRLLSVGDTAQTASPPATLTLAAGEIGGFAGCREYTGTYQARGDELRVTSISMRSTECGRGEAALLREGRFTGDLSESSNYRLSGDTLEVLTFPGRRLVFVKQR